MDAQDAQDLDSGVRRSVVLGIRKPGADHRPSRLLVQQPHVLLILCILCIHVKKIQFTSASDWFIFAQ